MPKRSAAPDPMSRAVFANLRTDRVARATAAHRELLHAARAVLDRLETMTTEQFSRGEDRPDRERLRAAVDRSNADAL